MQINSVQLTDGAKLIGNKHVQDCLESGKSQLALNLTLDKIA